MSKPAVVLYQHADHPEWGRGVALPQGGGRADRIDLSFELGGRRTILKRFSAKLAPVEMSRDEATALGEKLAGRRSASATVRTGAKRPKGVASTIATFDAQLLQFEAAFPGGFRGEKFESEERGVAGAKRRKSDKGAAIADAAAVLGEQAFAGGDAEAVFEAATALVRNTTLVHPLEGANTLGTMAAEHRGEFVAALRELLYGTHDEGDRFERFVAAIRLGGGSVAAKRPSWPLATMFAALVHPTRHVCVKPTFFQKQAALLKLPLDYQPLPSAEVYAQFVTMVRKTEAALRAAGQDPRDLVDVCSFICLTHGAKPAAKA